MAYSVAKELHLRPLDILCNWNCEELLVAFGEFQNYHSIANYDSLTPQQRQKHKPKPLTWMDRWAVPFLTSEQMAKMEEEAEKDNGIDLMQAANFLKI